MAVQSQLYSLGVGGVPQHRVKNLGDDLMGLFGAVGKAVQTYDVIGEQAAQIDFISQAADYNEELSQWKQASVAQDNNPDFFREYDNRVAEISAELVASGDKYKNHNAAFNKYNALSLDYSSNLQMNLRPSILKSELTSRQKVFTDSSSNFIDLSRKTGTTLTVSEISSIKDGAEKISIDPSPLVDKSFSNTMDIAITDLKSNTSKFISDRKLLVDGKLVPNWQNIIVDSSFSSFAEIDKDGNLVAKSGTNYVTDEHLSKVSSFISETYKLFSDGKEEKNVYAQAIFQKTQDTLASVKNGTMTIKQIQESQTNNNLTINELLDKTKTSINDTQRDTFVQGQVESDIAHETMIKAHRIVEDSVGKPDKLEEISTNGSKFFITVKDRTGKNTAKTVEAFVTSEQIKNIIQTQISEVEKLAVDKNTGFVNRDVIKAIVSSIQATDGSAKSALLKSTSNTVFRVGVPPEISSKKDLISAIEVQENALRYNMKPENFTSTSDAQAYLDNLKALTRNIPDNPNDKNNLSNMSKLFAEYKEQSTVAPKTTSNVNSFILKNRGSVVSVFNKEEGLNSLNKIFGHGQTQPIPTENHDSFIRLYKMKYPSDETVDNTKYAEMIKDDAHYIGGAFFFGDKKVVLPPIRSDGGMKVSNYQIMDTLTPEMKRLGIENLEDMKDTTVFVSYNKYGQSFLNLKYYDTNAKLYKIKSWSGKEVSKHQYKEPAWYDFAEQQRNKEIRKGK